MKDKKTQEEILQEKLDIIEEKKREDQLWGPYDSEGYPKIA